MNLAEQGRGQGHAYIHDAVQSARLDAAASSVKHKQLPNALRSGVGFHYAAMEQEDRAVVEQLFHDRMLPVSIFDASLRFIPRSIVVMVYTHTEKDFHDLL